MVHPQFSFLKGDFLKRWYHQTIQVIRPFVYWNLGFWGTPILGNQPNLIIWVPMDTPSRDDVMTRQWWFFASWLSFSSSFVASAGSGTSSSGQRSGQQLETQNKNKGRNLDKYGRKLDSYTNAQVNLNMTGIFFIHGRNLDKWVNRGQSVLIVACCTVAKNEILFSQQSHDFIPLGMECCLTKSE